MKNWLLIKRYCLILLFAVLGVCQVYGANYYAKVTASAIGPTGAGTVYAGTTSTNGSTGTRITATGSTNESGGNVDFTFKATPTGNYDFKGWTSTNNVNGSIESDATQYTKPYKASATANDENKATTYNIYAIFVEKPLFYFRGTAIVVSEGAGIGEASVEPETAVGARGERWNSTSATTNTIAFRANEISDDYAFYGWSTSENGDTVSSKNPYYPALTSKSKDSGNPTNTTYYARFKPYPTAITASPTSIILGVGSSSAPITALVIPAGSYKNIAFESDKPSVASVDANGVVTAGSAAGNAVITVKALKSDGVTVVTTTTVPVSVLEKCAAPVITLIPSPDGNTATVSLKSATVDATLYYTVDGSEPTTSSTPYNNTPFTINSGQTVKSVAVREGYYNSDISTDMFTATKVATPTIDITSGGVTFSSGTSGASFYYTTNGDNPTTSLAPWDGIPITGLGDGVTIKVIATKSGMITSDMATKIYYPVSNADGTTVTLNDLEDHNWTYYSGVDTSVDGGNYNTNYAGKLYSPNPRNVKITYNGVNGISGSSTTVKVSIDEPETKFVYYKTLEEGTSDNYPYQVISNPFSVRPSTGSGGGKVYYGFAGWKIVSGHQYIKRADGKMAAEGATLSLDEEITFVGLPYPSVNCISAEIVFETTWKIANRTYISSNPDNAQTYGTDGDYESNFYVINCNYTRTITTSGPVTIMMVEPDGSDDYRDNTFSGNITPDNTGVTKIEWARWSPSGNIDARGLNLTIGRGMNLTGDRRVYGLNTSSRGVNQTVKIESGTLGSFYHYGQRPSSITKQIVVFGNDYDRAKKDDTKLNITRICKISSSLDFQLSDSKTMLCRTYSKSGKIMSGVEVGNAATDNVYYYSPDGGNNNYRGGCRYLEIQGGEWCCIAGGFDNYHNEDDPAFTFRMKGGTIRGSVYGAGEFYSATGIRSYVLTGGVIKGWVAAGANGTQPDGGKVSGKSYMYIGGNTRIDSKGSTDVINRAVGGNVFGAGCGYSKSSLSGEVTGGTNVVIADDAYVERGVYGGGSYGFTENNSYMYITGGHVAGLSGGVNGNVYDGSIHGGVYGGSCQNKGGSSNIYMTGGLVEGGLYGGSNFDGIFSGSTKLVINGGQVGIPGAPANIHGGGYGSATRVSQNVEITLGNEGQTTEGVQVYGDVYGGSALGYVNGTTASDAYHTYVTLNKGTINGSLYGGGLGEGTTAANVYGPVKVTVKGGSVKRTLEAGSGGVYGANNVYGAPQRSVTVDIYGTDPAPTADEYALHAVYGGGNMAPYTYGNGYPTVTVHNCNNSIEYVYGGGNAAAVAATNVTIWGGDVIGNVFGGGNGESGEAADVNGNASTTIHGGTILNVFGGSNRTGTIGGTITVRVEEQTEEGHDACPVCITDLYGGGNRAASKAGNITIGCAEYIGNVYGGANAADITGDINLLISSGHIDNVFGGNNNSGIVTGNITVTVNDSGKDCGMEVGNVYGAGNKAAYPGGPVVNIQNGRILNRVFGGGLGETATVTGNPRVNMTGGTVGYTETVDGKEVVRGGDVFGGGDAAPVVGNTQVVITGGEVKRNVYGGGNQASVSGTTNVQIGPNP